MSYEQQNRMVGWFNEVGVNRLNLAVLQPVDGKKARMLQHDRERDIDEARRAFGWAWAENVAGRNVYVRPARGSAWPVVLLDDVSPAVARELVARYTALAVQTSAGSCHTWIATDKKLEEDERRQVQEHLIPQYGADPGSKSGDHFGRLAGYKNRKPGRGDCWINIIASSLDKPKLAVAALLEAQAASIPPAQRAGAVGAPRSASIFSSPARSGRHSAAPDSSASAQEFGWACGWLRAGLPADEAIRRLAERAESRGKAGDPLRYARLTVSNAARACGQEVP